MSFETLLSKDSWDKKFNTHEKQVLASINGLREFNKKQQERIFLKFKKTTNLESPVTEIHLVPPLSNRVRLQEYAIGIFENALTKSAVKKAIKKQCIKVNGVVANSALFIHGGEQISLIQATSQKTGRQLIFNLDVLFEDEYLAVVHKPAGILVSGNGFKTIAHALVQNIQASTLSDTIKPQPVHRLDYATTGALLVGKTSSSIRALNKLFEDKKIEKVYCAITIGEMDKKGQIVLKVDNKPSQSNYEVLEAIPSKRFGQLNLVKLHPTTGRRHQLRKHLSSIGNPILGDKEYGIDPLILMGKGLYLHAHLLRFMHPFTNQEIYIRDQLPKKFEKIFGSINRPPSGS